MRIAYIAEYQGPGLIKQRGIKSHRSLAQSMKIELIANALCSIGHEIEIISQGVVIERKGKYFRSFREPEPFHPCIPIYYSAALDIRLLRGALANVSTLSTFKRRHAQKPYDLVIIYNLKDPQIRCAHYALNCLKLPVILEYEDDSFVDKLGKATFRTLISKYKAQGLQNRLSACFAASPHLLCQISHQVPKLLLRGVVGEDLVKLSKSKRMPKKKWVLFSGGHDKQKGIEQLIKAWYNIDLPGWELHITGYGSLTGKLQSMVQNSSTIVFHGLVSREELIHLLCSARICINPHEVSHTPGNVFAFKIIEYLAAGAHVITTPMGIMEKELEKGITYIPDNSPDTILAAMNTVIATHENTNTAMEYVHGSYSVLSVSKSLDELIKEAASLSNMRNNGNSIVGGA